MLRGKPIYLNGNDDRPLQQLLELDTANPPHKKAAVGVAGLTYHIAAGKDGAAIDASLTKPATEVGEGWYTCVLEGNDIMTHLAPFAGLDVVQVLKGGTDVCINVQRRVQLSRP